MNFDYLTCIGHNVIVDERNVKEHGLCALVGRFFKTKKPSKNVDRGLISRVAIEKAKEEQNVIRYHKRKEKKKLKEKLEQIRFSKQMPRGDILVNLAVVMQQ